MRAQQIQQQLKLNADVLTGLYSEYNKLQKALKHELKFQQCLETFLLEDEEYLNLEFAEKGSFCFTTEER